jgi:hypothetical protein
LQERRLLAITDNENASYIGDYGGIPVLQLRCRRERV